MENVTRGPLWEALVDGLTAEEQAALKQTVTAELRKQWEAEVPRPRREQSSEDRQPG